MKKKNYTIPIILVLLFIIIAGGFIIYTQEVVEKEKFAILLVYKKDMKKGEQIQKEDITVDRVPFVTEEEVSSTLYVSQESLDGVVGHYLARNVHKGEGLKWIDYEPINPDDSDSQSHNTQRPGQNQSSPKATPQQGKTEEEKKKDAGN